MADISIIAGESRVINVSAVNEAGTAIDLTNASIAWIMAETPYGTPTIAKAGVIDGPPTEGKFKVTLTSADTTPLNGNFYQSATLTFLDGSVSTIFLGLIAVSPLSELSSVEMFKIRYPEFASVSNALISLILAEAGVVVTDAWFEDDRQRAQMLWAAHRLTVEGEPARSSGGGSIALSGPVKSHKVGDVSVEFAGVGGGGADRVGFASTTYGQEFLELMRMNFGSVIALNGPNLWP